MSNLHFLFLQGMPCYFFRKIGERLSQLGHNITGINFCVGDLIFWHGCNTVNYRGRLEDWPEFLSNFFTENNITDIVLLGEQRNYHKLAVKEAKKRGIRVSVTDFGYLRPDWITLERNGMSGDSLFPKNINKILELNSKIPKIDLSRKFEDSSRNMAINDLLYNIVNMIDILFFPNYKRSDKRPSPIVFVPMTCKRYFLQKIYQKRLMSEVNAILKKSLKFFIFPLQLEHDFQIVAYSDFNDLIEPLKMIIKSFAKHSAQETHLIIKAHPYDIGVRNWNKIISKIAKEFSISGRVHFIDGCDLNELTKASSGMITINSTSGFTGLQMGKPVKALGKAVYDIAELTYQDSLDSFWKNAKPPKKANVEAFINVLVYASQIRGVFFNKSGFNYAVNEAVERLSKQKVGPLCYFNT